LRGIEDNSWGFYIRVEGDMILRVEKIAIAHRFKLIGVERGIVKSESPEGQDCCDASNTKPDQIHVEASHFNFPWLNKFSSRLT
jgi:hypothetical protein